MYIMCHLAVAQSVDCMPFNDEEPEARRSSTFPKVTKLVSSGVGILTQVCQTPEAMLFTVQPASVTKSAVRRRFEGRGVIDGVGRVSDSPGSWLQVGLLGLVKQLTE